MQLKLKSYRGFILKILIPFFVLYVILIASMSIYFALNVEDSKDLIPYLIVLTIVAVILLCLILTVKLYNGAHYIFEKDKINVYSRKKHISKIDIADIEIIYYHPFRFRYLITMFSGELADGGAWKIHLKLKDGTKKSLAFFSIKDVKKIKKFYGDLVEIV